MADPKLVKRLWQGSAAWNAWRAQQRPGQVFDLSDAKLMDAKLMDADLSGAKLMDADLHSANLRGAILSSTDLSGADLRGAILSRAYLNGAHLSGAYLNGADLNDADLYTAYLSAANLSGADLSGANLHQANLSTANLSDANLRGANLRGAILNGAHLSGVHLNGADLSGAHLSGAYLISADLNGADLSNADLSHAMVGNTVFAQVDFRETKGLVEIKHQGPSVVQLHTVQLPQDGSALHFLRGTGIPDEYIDLWRAATMYPIQYHSLFISYSSKDNALARRLHADLQAHGVRCWFAPEDMKIGDKIRTRIDEAIHLQDKLLLLLSEHALTSAWVEDEVDAALEKEQQQQREVLFPVRLDESMMQTTQAWAAKLRRSRHIGDFTNWTDPQAYQQAFERLLRDLRPEKTS